MLPWLLWLQDTWRDVPYDWASLLENVLDASHVPFTHHKCVGRLRWPPVHVAVV